MHTVKFERVMRDCPHNEKLTATGANRGFIYDFKVIVDGEHRATFDRHALRERGYELFDAYNEPIRAVPSNRFGLECQTQDMFGATISNLLLHGDLPNLNDQAANYAQREEVRVESLREHEESRVRRVKMMAAEEMYDALKYAEQILESYKTTNVGSHPHAIETVKAAIAKAEGR